MNDNLFARLYLWLVTHRRSVLVVVALLMAGALWISSRIQLQEDILDMLPGNDAQVDEYRYALRKFRQIDRLYLDIGINQDDPETLARAADEVYGQLSTNHVFTRITYQINSGGMGKVVEFLTGALPNLFVEADAVALEAKLTPASVREHLVTMQRKLAGPEGMVLKKVVAADPIGMTPLMAAKTLPLQAGFGSAQIVDGRITSGDGRHVLMMVEPKFGSSDSKLSAALMQEMMRVVGAVEQQFPGVHVAITGGHRMALDNATLLRRDATHCMMLAITAMFILCFSAYRRRWLATVTFLPSLFGTIIAGTVLALVDEQVSAIATGFASMAIGITVDYGIYVVYHLDNAATDRRTAAKILGRLLLPTFIGAMTIIAAFVVLACSPMHGYRQLGIFGATGVLMSAVFALVVLPLLVPLPKKTEPELPQLRFTGWMENFHAWQKRNRPLLLLAMVVLTVVTLFGLKRLRFEGDFAKLNGITEATRADDKLINQTWGDALSMTLLVSRGPTVADALAQNDRLATLLTQQTNVAGVYSLASVCPALATQEENIQRWQRFWTSERQSALRANLQQIGGELGFQPDAFAPFWKSVTERPALLTLDYFRHTPLEQALAERVAIGTNDTAISTLIKLNDRSQAGDLRAALPGFILIDQKHFTDHIATLAKHGMVYFALWTVLAVGLIVYLSLASIELVIATLLPIGFGLLWTLGLMGLLDLPINVMNCVFVIFVIGMGEDYSVFLATSKLDEWRGHPPRIHATSASVFISAAITIFGFAVLIFAKHPVLFSMGTTVLLGMVSAFLATLVVTPACVELLLFKPQPRGAPRWWHLLGTGWVALYLCVSQLFLYCGLRPILKVVAPKTADDRLRRATRWLARWLVKNMPFGKLEFQNITEATFAKPGIVISNHQSAVDVILMVSLPGDVRQTAKKRVFDAPMLGFGCKILGHVMVEPNDPQTTLQRCRTTLASGASVHFYPEGTRSVDGSVQRFHRGAFELAIELKQDILPIVLCDSNVVMPRDSYWFEPFHTTVRALPRITPQNFDYAQGVVPLMKHCETIVRVALQEQLDAINTPRVVRRKVERLYRYQGIYVEQFVKWKMKLDPFFLKLDSVVPRQAHVLDLGCGYGMASHWLAAFTDTRTFWGVDYDEDKIRVAQRSATEIARIKFAQGDLLECDLPPADAALLLDVLHYWIPEKQQLILNKVRQALRPGGRLILRDGARTESAEHRNIHRWEVFATRLGMNRTKEGLHFQTLGEMEAMLKRAGFTRWELQPGAGNDSNVMLVAWA